MFDVTCSRCQHRWLITDRDVLVRWADGDHDVAAFRCLGGHVGTFRTFRTAPRTPLPENATTSVPVPS